MRALVADELTERDRPYLRLRAMTATGAMDGKGAAVTVGTVLLGLGDGLGRCLATAMIPTRNLSSRVRHVGFRRSV